MGKAKMNYSRFYAIAKSKGIDLAQFKDDLVLQFTDGRTTSLKEMKEAEYIEMCDCLQYDRRKAETDEEFQARRRKARSAVLNRLQCLGVDTTDFARVNNFCLDKRIAGKVFGMLTIDELNALIPKLEAMLRKPRKEAPAHEPAEAPKEQAPAQAEAGPTAAKVFRYIKFFKPASTKFLS